MRRTESLYANNNFDLIRLVAATQVVVVHCIVHLKVISLASFATIAELVPGVPAFFFISGFLISAAWQRNPDVRVFYKNRAYRILPALWASVLVAVATLFMFFDRGVLAAHASGLVTWIVGQSTIFQAWNPGFLRTYGVGVVNGSLWTIPVELAFYALVPPIAWVFARRINPNRVLPAVIVAAFAINYLVNRWSPSDVRLMFAQKAVMVSPLPWFGMFFLGMLVQHNIDRLYPIFVGRLWLFVSVFIVVSALTAVMPLYPILAAGNTIGVANYLALCALVLSAAYSYRSLSDAVLRRNDISYGIYIGHMIVVNVLVQLGLFGVRALAIGLPIMFGMATLSWFLLEKPVLARRKASLYRR